MGTRGTSSLKLNAFEMLRRPGTSKSIRLSAEPSSIELEDHRLEPGSEIEIDLQGESLTDGILVSGAIEATFRAECRRCLKPIVGTLRAEVRELYQVEITDPDAFAIEGDYIDLGPMIRETVLLDLPEGPLCRIDCAGLCATCGTDLNEGACSCPTDSVDPRWSVLDALRGQIPD